MIRYITTVCLLFACFCCLAQSHGEYLAKYNAYRARFLNEFIDLGTEPGQSLPMAGRYPEANCEWDWFPKYNSCPPSKGKGIAVWGDGGIEMGNYLMLLALEVRNLKEAGEKYSASVEELWLALKATERLDQNAETYFGLKGKLDGFFVRDDVPQDFLVKSDGKKRFKFKTGKELSCVVSDGSCDLEDFLDGSVMSQDQIMNLFFGLVFVSELVPLERHNNERLGDIASDIADRIAGFLVDNNWKIISPNGERPEHKWGGNATPFSFAIAGMAERITRGKKRKTYQNGASRRRGKVVFGTFNWAHGVQAENNLWMAYCGIVGMKKWNLKKLTRRAKKSHREMYSLAYSVLNGLPASDKISRKDIEAMLHSAPFSGPCNGTPGCEAPDGWKCSDRWVHAEDRNGSKHNINRDFNGMDYMILFNLYHYLYKPERNNYRINFK